MLLAFCAGAMLHYRGQPPPSDIALLAKQHRKAILEATILEPPRVTGFSARFRIRVHRVITGRGELPAGDDLLLTVYRHCPALQPGERIRFPARLRSFRNFGNPGRYDYTGAMKLKGITCAAAVSDGRRIVPMGRGDPGPWRGFMEAMRRPLRDGFERNLSPPQCALFRALILGERQAIDYRSREAFNRSGLGHMLAVSGLHIGLVAWVSFALFRWILSRSYRLSLQVDVRKLAAGLACVPVVGYACLAGLHVSTQRAMIMALVFLFSMILGREKEVWSSLALAALLILALTPDALFSISFQLSFAAVIGILWLTPPILKRIPVHPPVDGGRASLWNRITMHLAGLTALNLSATLFLLPVIMHYFHRVSLVTVPANLTVVPILGLVVIPSGLIFAAVLPFSMQAAAFFLLPGIWGLHALTTLVRFWSGLPWSSLWVFTPTLLEICLFYGLIFFLFFLRRRTWAVAGLGLFLLIAFADAGYWIYRVRFNRDLRVTFLDVGQGSAALVEFPNGRKMMVDGGGFPGGRFDVGRMVVAPYLWRLKVLRVDYLVLSHPQADHMNGLRFIARVFHPREFWYNGDTAETAPFRELMALVESTGVRVRRPIDLQGGTKINGVRVEVLHPPPEGYFPGSPDRSPGINNNSLVLRISFRGTSFLLPGDLEHEGEAALLARNGKAIKSDVLLVPHHGSRGSSSPQFLRAVRPRVCVISCGAGNYFGFPHEQTLRRLKAAGCRILRTDRSGAIRCIVGTRGFRIETFGGDGNR